MVSSTAPASAAEATSTRLTLENDVARLQTARFGGTSRRDVGHDRTDRVVRDAEPAHHLRRQILQGDAEALAGLLGHGRHHAAALGVEVQLADRHIQGHRLAVAASGAVGDLESVRAILTVWISRPAANDAAGQSVLLATDLARLRHELAVLDPTEDGRVNVGEGTVTDIRPRGPEAVTVVGRIVVEFDYEADAENP